MRRVKVEVTADDIDNGERGKPCSCPVALALRRVLSDVDDEFGLWKFWDKNTAKWHLGIGVNTRLTQAPSDVETFAYNFDRDIFVEPFTFEVELP